MTSTRSHPSPRLGPNFIQLHHRSRTNLLGSSVRGGSLTAAVSSSTSTLLLLLGAGLSGLLTLLSLRGLLAGLTLLRSLLTGLSLLDLLTSLALDLLSVRGGALLSSTLGSLALELTGGGLLLLRGDGTSGSLG